MKLLLVLCIAAVLFVGCKKDETSKTTDESLKKAETTEVAKTEVKDEKKVEEVKTDEVKKEEVKVDANAIPFVNANNYFVKNTFKDGDLKSPKITTQEEFDKVFGAATVMGDNGKPTQIDFANQYVVTYIHKETDLTTTLSVESFVKNEKGELVFNYKVTEGEKQSFTTKPVLIIVVDKKYEGNVVLNQLK